MALLDKLERKWGWLAVPKLSLLIIFGQIIVYVLLNSAQAFADLITLVPALVAAGQVWRLVTFLFWPPIAHPVFMALAWYFFYLLGSALEGYWGDFRYTVFVLIGWAATVIFAMFAPLFFPDYAYAVVSNAFLGGSVFLAFARLNPEFEILLFFILPVKIKWLALLTWLGYLYILLFGDWPGRFAVVASVLNYLLFFGRDIYVTVRSGHRQMGRRTKEIRDSRKAVHRCRICDATEKSHPDYEFRYCSKCSAKACYCMEHLKDHQHV